MNDILDNAKQELLDRVAQDRKYSSSKLRAGNMTVDSMVPT